MSQPPHGAGHERQAGGSASQGEQRPWHAAQSSGATALDDVQAPIRVALADDSPLIRQGVEALLAAEPDIEVVAVCEDGARLERAVAERGPHVVVLDLRMPPSGELEGLRLARMLSERYPTTGVILLSQHVEPEYALELMRDGTSRRAYLLKDNLRDGAELAGAIRAVSAGGSVVDPQVVDALLRDRVRERPSPLADLTGREREVLEQMAQGMSNSAIARSLVLTQRAVEKHVNSIFSKLDLGDPHDVSRRVKAVLLFLADVPREQA